MLASRRLQHAKQGCAEDGMMSPKRWILLLIFYVSYLMFGASIYYHIEHGLEREKRAEQLKERIEINEFLLDQLADKNTTTQNEVLEKITDYCGKPVTDYNSDEFEIPYTWTFYHSFFFAFTVCSTVGYGNISPTTTLGRMIMIVYSVIGIPVNGILFAGLGEYFGKTFSSIYRRYKKYKMSNNVQYVPPQLGLITIVTMALVPGVTLFLLLPSWVFTIFEGWDYPLAFYYSYVTTTTIGFGDYVPTFGPNQPREFGAWFVVYQIFVIVWFIFSLGYLLMIMTFITRGLQSKKLAHLEQQLSTNIKATQNRIWNGVTKDVGYLRRILNEMYILKFKPVYTEPDFSHLLHRSLSCPELSMYRVDPPPAYSRKRAFSVCYDVMEARAAAEGNPPLVHSSSETDLDKFDRTKSFEAAEAFRQTTGLLSKVVNALATVRAPVPEDDIIDSTSDIYGGGYHGFSDSQILASEWSFGSINDVAHAPSKPRGRACSDFNIVPQWQREQRQRRATELRQHNEWTWSGDNNQIQEAINNRQRNNRENLYRNSFGLPQPHDYIVNMEDEELRKQQTVRAKKFSIPDGFRRLFPFKKRASEADFMAAAGRSRTSNAQAAASERKYSIVSVPETQHRAPPLDYYSTVTANASPSYFRNEKTALPVSGMNGNIGDYNSAASIFPSEASIASRRMSTVLPPYSGSNGGAGGYVNRGFTDPEQATFNSSATASSYQRNAAAANAKKRRESIFAQNPALAARRGSMFAPNSSTAALSQRRGSLFNQERRGSTASTGAAAAMGLPPRRGSLFPPAADARRPSLFSVSSQQDLEVLETTTLADLIRALEVMHTQAVMEDGGGESATASGRKNSNVLDNIFRSDKKKRKVGSAGLDPPQLPPILGLFAGDNTRTLTATAANRLYARRATIVGTLPSFTPTTLATNQTTTAPLSTSNVLTRRRQSSVQIVEPPPSYSEREPLPPTAGAVPSSANATKFKRRFSIRPTALQIPPGKAPPPGVNINNLLQQSPSSSSGIGGATTASGPSTQTALQRRLSLRPSPLAREPNLSPIPPSPQQSVGGAIDTGPISPNTTTASSTTRLLPPPVLPRPLTSPTSSSSTHSPLSRIAQLTQAQRKISMPEKKSGDK